MILNTSVLDFEKEIVLKNSQTLSIWRSFCQILQFYVVVCIHFDFQSAIQEWLSRFLFIISFPIIEVWLCDLENVIFKIRKNGR